MLKDIQTYDSSGGLNIRQKLTLKNLYRQSMEKGGAMDLRHAFGRDQVL